MAYPVLVTCRAVRRASCAHSSRGRGRPPPPLRAVGLRHGSPRGRRLAPRSAFPRRAARRGRSGRAARCSCVAGRARAAARRCGAAAGGAGQGARRRGRQRSREQQRRARRRRGKARSPSGAGRVFPLRAERLVDDGHDVGSDVVHSARVRPAGAGAANVRRLKATPASDQNPRPIRPLLGTARPIASAPSTQAQSCPARRLCRPPPCVPSDPWPARPGAGAALGSGRPARPTLVHLERAGHRRARRRLPGKQRARVIAQVLVMTHEDADGVLTLPYLSTRFRGVPIREFIGRTASNVPPCRMNEALFYGWRDSAVPL